MNSKIIHFSYNCDPIRIQDNILIVTSQCRVLIQCVKNNSLFVTLFCKNVVNFMWECFKSQVEQKTTLETEVFSKNVLNVLPFSLSVGNRYFL